MIREILLAVFTLVCAFNLKTKNNCILALAVIGLFILGYYRGMELMYKLF